MCLLGFYCPVESVTPVPCPKGTYGLTADAVSIDSCLVCPPHHYCPRPGLSAFLPCGPEAEQPHSGQDTCICPREGQSFQVTKCFPMFVALTFSMCVPSALWMWLCNPPPLRPPIILLGHFPVFIQKNSNYSRLCFFCVVSPGVQCMHHNSPQSRFLTVSEKLYTQQSVASSWKISRSSSLTAGSCFQVCCILHWGVGLFIDLLRRSRIILLWALMW